jgi:hypothetical protein
MFPEPRFCSAIRIRIYINSSRHNGRICAAAGPETYSAAEVRPTGRQSHIMLIGCSLVQFEQHETFLSLNTATLIRSLPELLIPGTLQAPAKPGREPATPGAAPGNGNAHGRPANVTTHPRPAPRTLAE